MEEIIKLLLAVLVGGLIGSEREFRHGLGLRTLMLVCLGATMFTIYSRGFAQESGDPRRVAAAVVTGVGFLGAGVILREKGRIMGLTTAASIWVVAALGMGIGLGLYLFVAAATALVFAVLWGIPRLAALTNARKTYTYQATCVLDEAKYEALNALFSQAGLTLNDQTVAKQGDQMICIWQAHGSWEAHEAVMSRFLGDTAVIEFHIV